MEFVRQTLTAVAISSLVSAATWAPARRGAGIRTAAHVRGKSHLALTGNSAIPDKLPNPAVDSVENLPPAAAGEGERGGEGEGEERSLAQHNCNGHPAELLADSGASLIALLHSEDGRRAAKVAALRTLLANASDARAASFLADTRAVSLCDNSWLDWLPWLSCRVQSPPARPHFLDEEEERGDDDGDGPLCWPADDVAADVDRGSTHPD